MLNVDVIESQRLEEISGDHLVQFPAKGSVQQIE